MLSRRAFLHASLWVTPTLLFSVGCSGSRPGVTAQIDWGLPAPLSGTMTFTLLASCIWDAPNPDADGTKTTGAEVSFSMTDGLVPLDPQWVATPIREEMTSYRRPVVFKANVPQSFELKVRLDGHGEQRISGGVEVMLLGSSHSDKQTLFLNVSSTSTRVQRDPFTPTR